MNTPRTRSDDPRDMHMMVSDLPASDLARLAAFLRVGSDRLRHRWSFTDTTDATLYVYGGDAAPTMPASLEHTPALIRIVDRGAAVEDGEAVLVRPIQFEAFVEAMVQIESARLAPDAAAPVDVALASGASAADAEAGSGANGAAGAAARPLAGALAEEGATIRLRRWPRNPVLARSRYGLRMASFLTARQLTIPELAELCNVEPEECARFVALLVEEKLATVSVPHKTGTPPAPKAPMPMLPMPAVARRTLLGRLRERLGLGLKATLR